MRLDDITEVLAAPGLLIAAKEAGAGSLLAALLERAGRAGGVRVLAEPPADRYFPPGRVSPQVLADSEPGALATAAVQALTEHRPDVVVVGASAGFTIEKALIDAGRAASVPVVSAIDHFWNLWQRYAWPTPADRWRFRPDAILVPDAWCVRRLNELGCPVATLGVFEHPLLWPSAVARTPEARQRARAAAGIPNAAFVLVFVSEYVFADGEGWEWDQPQEADIHAAGRQLAAMAGKIAAKTGRELWLVVRLHPAEATDWSGSLAVEGSARLLVDRTLDKAALIAAADMAIGLNSMLLAEAARSGLATFSWIPSGICRGARLSDLVVDVRRLADQQACRAAIESAVFSTV